MITENFIEVEEKTTGLIIRRNASSWLRKIQAKPGKKFLREEPNTWLRNQAMLGLARDGHLPVVTDHLGIPVIYTDGISSPVTPTKWEKADERLRVVYYQAAIERLAAESEDLVPLTLHLNLTPEFTREALNKGGMSYIHHRLLKRLSKAVGRRVDLWMAMETVDDCKEQMPFTGRPHIHGSVLLTREEAQRDGAGRIAIRDVSGGDITLSFRRTALKLKNLEESRGGGTGHALYATKRRAAAVLMLPYSSLLSCSNRVRALAKELYEQDRQALRKRIH